MATYYIDADIGSDSNAGTSETAPWKTLAKIATASAWTAGNTINARGTFLETMTPNGSGSAGSPCVFQAWGSDVCVIDGAATRTSCINITSRDYITISGITVTRAQPSDSYGGAILIHESGNIVIEDCAATANKGCGIRMTAVTQRVDCRITNCTATANGGHGISIAGAYRGTLISGCTATANGTLVGAHGISVHCNRTGVTTGWSGAGPIYTRAFSTHEVHAVIDRSATPWTRLTENTATPTTPGSNEFGTSGGTLYINLGGTDPAGRSILLLDDLAKQNIVRRCTARSTAAFGGSEGHGLVADDSVSDVHFVSCLSIGNAGHGISLNATSNCTVRGTVVDCTGVSGSSLRGIANADYSVSNTLANNTIVAAPSYGIFFGAGSSGIARNNIVINSVQYGIVNAATATATAAGNCLYNNTLGNLVNITDSTKVQVNPELRSDYMPLSASVRSVASGCVGGDYYGYDLRNSIGAVQYHPARSVVSREVATRSTVTRSTESRIVTA